MLSSLGERLPMQMMYTRPLPVKSKEPVSLLNVFSAPCIVQSIDLQYPGIPKGGLSVQPLTSYAP